MDVFDLMIEDEHNKNVPLAERMKPQSLSDFVGQEHIINKDSFLSKMIESDDLRSIILHGSAGVGKTTIAGIIAKETKSNFIKLNAVSSGVSDIKEAVIKAKDSRLYGKNTILFIDEIHRFNKRQQDALLPYVENGILTLIGATTENPYFEVNSALISRVMVLHLKSLDLDDISKIIKNAISKDIKISKAFSSVEDEAISIFYRYSSGDARKALNALDICSLYSNGNEVLTAELVKKSFDSNSMSYDKSGDMHYDLISAFIKSIRGSDPQAAIHYLARMIVSGEDPMFIARRLIILASEDVGNADPMALLVAVAAKDAVQMVGMPEGRIALAQATTYLASTLKSNKAYLAINKAIYDVENNNIGSIPSHLRDRAYSKLDDSKACDEYLYPHDFSGAYVKQEYMPEALKGTVYYEPSERGREKTIKSYLDILSGGRDDA